MTADNRRHLRRQSWAGLKAPAKRAMSLPFVHSAVRLAGTRMDEASRARLPAPSRLREVTATMSGVEFVMVQPDRCILAKELYWGRGVRPGAQDQFALDLFAKLARTVDAVLDIGSYTGVFSLLSARVNPTAQIHAFEIIPEVHNVAWLNVARNDLLGRVHVHLQGVGDDGSTARVPLGTGGSALPDFLSVHTQSEGVAVPLRSLDSVYNDLLRDATVASLLIKLDIEGLEPSALDGGQHLLAALAPDMLCEVLPNTDLAGLPELLLTLGYATYAVGRQSLHHRARLTNEPGYRDWLFTTRSPDALRDLGIAVTDNA